MCERVMKCKRNERGGAFKVRRSVQLTRLYVGEGPRPKKNLNTVRHTVTHEGEGDWKRERG